MFLIWFIALALISHVRTDDRLVDISFNHTSSQLLKFSSQNQTIGFRVDWGNVESLKKENKFLELIIEANITERPFQQYQVPFMCLNNKTATTFSRKEITHQPHINAIECDIYGYRTNEGIYRINLNSSNFTSENEFFISFFNLTSLSNKELHQIPVGDIMLDNNGTDDNFWNIDLVVGIYPENSKPLDCNMRGVYNETSQICICETNFAGVYCEFQLQTLISDFTQKVVIQPYEFSFFKFNYDDLYNLVLEMNDTVAFNFFFCDQVDTEAMMQHRFISTFFSKSYKLQSKKKPQVLPLPYNLTVNSIVFWFKNDNTHPIEMELVLKETSKSFLEDFIQVLVSYLFYTLIGGLLFCGCSFLMVVLASKVHKSWTIFMRRRQMEKQLPKMTYLQFKSNQRLHRNNSQTSCSICLGEYEDDDSIRVTWCRHAFHRDCIEEWALKKNQCPFCRETIFTFLYSSIIELLKSNQNRNNEQNSSEENNSQNSAEVQLANLTNNNNNNHNNNNDNNQPQQNNRYQNLVETQ